MLCQQYYMTYVGNHHTPILRDYKEGDGREEEEKWFVVNGGRRGRGRGGEERRGGNWKEIEIIGVNCHKDHTKRFTLKLLTKCEPLRASRNLATRHPKNH